jgi:hypothetical protein
MLGIGHGEIKEVSIADGWVGRFNIRTSSHETDVGHCGDDFLHGLSKHVVTLVTLFAGEVEDEWTFAEAVTEPESLGISLKNIRRGHSGETKLTRRNALLYKVRVFRLRADKDGIRAIVKPNIKVTVAPLMRVNERSDRKDCAPLTCNLQRREA